MYDSYHEVINASRQAGKKEKVSIVGNICESGDFLARDRMMPRAAIGDVLMVKNAGAYGYSMSSDYNLRPKPAEVLVMKGKVKKI